MFGKTQIIFRSEAGENVVKLSASSFMRRLGFGTSWTRLRIGIRVRACSGAQEISYGTGLTPRFGVGLCASSGAVFTRNMVAGHWVGIITTGATWNVVIQGASEYTLGFVSAAPAKKVDSTLTVGTNFSYGPSVGGGEEPTTTLTLPVLYFVDIEKGSPNYSMRLFNIPNPANGGGQSRAQFLEQMVLDTPSLLNYLYAAAQTIAVDEGADGTLDAINIFNELPTEIEILDLGLVILA